MVFLISEYPEIINLWWKDEDMEKAITAVRERKMGTLKSSKILNVPLQTLS